MRARMTLLLPVAALAVAVSGCAQKDPFGSASNGPRTAGTTRSPVPVNPFSTPKPTPSASKASGPVPVGPWHAGPSAIISGAALPPGGTAAAAATVTFPGRDGRSIVSTANQLIGVRPNGGTRLFVRALTGTVVGTPIFDRSGRGVIVLARQIGAACPAVYRLRWTEYDPVSGLGKSHVLAERAQYPSFAADTSGDAVAAWMLPPSTPAEFAPQRIQAAVRAGSRPFGKPVTLLQNGSSSHFGGNAPVGPAVAAAIGRGGSLVVTAAGQPTSGEPAQVLAWTGRAAKGFAAQPIVIGTRETGVAFTAAVSTTGRAFVAWGDQSSGEDADSPWVVRATSIAPDVSAAAPVQSIDRGIAVFPAAFPTMVADAKGGAVLAWSGTRYSHKRRPKPSPVLVSTSGADGAFGRVQTLAGAGALGGLAVAPGGDAIITWLGFSPGPDRRPTGFFASARPAGAARFEPAEQIPGPIPPADPGLASPIVPTFDSTGRPVAAYVTPASKAQPAAAIHLVRRDEP